MEVERAGKDCLELLPLCVGQSIKGRAHGLPSLIARGIGQQPFHGRDRAKGLDGNAERLDPRLALIGIVTLPIGKDAVDGRCVDIGRGCDAARRAHAQGFKKRDFRAGEGVE